MLNLVSVFAPWTEGIRNEIFIRTDTTYLIRDCWRSLNPFSRALLQYLLPRKWCPNKKTFHSLIKNLKTNTQRKYRPEVGNKYFYHKSLQFSFMIHVVCLSQWKNFCPSRKKKMTVHNLTCKNWYLDRNLATNLTLLPKIRYEPEDFHSLLLQLPDWTKCKTGDFHSIIITLANVIHGISDDILT